MKLIKKGIRVTLHILGITLFLAYLSWHADLLPSSLGIIGYIDDAIVAIALYIIINLIIRKSGADVKRR